MYRLLILLVVHFALGGLVFAQSGFVRNYPLTDGHYYFSGISLSADGRIVLHGVSDGMLSHAYHTQVNAFGNPEWVLEYRHLTVEYFWGKGNIGDSLFFDAGITSANQKIMSDPFLMCYDARGRMRWFKQYTSPAYDQFTDLSISPDGEFFGMGPTNDSSHIQKTFVMKMNRQGDPVWQRSFAGTLFQEGYAAGIAALPQGEVVFGVVYPEQPDAYHLIRLDSLGNLLADRAYLVDGRNPPSYRMALRANGNLLCRDRYERIRELSLAGDELREFQAAGMLDGMLELRDGGILLYGQRAGADFFMQKIDADWSEVWRKDFDLPHDNDILDACELPSRELLLAGYHSSGAFTQGLLLRTDCEGNLTDYTHCLPPGPEYTLWPNPSDGSTTLSIPADLAGQPHQVEVWNALGQRVHAQSPAPTQFVDLDLRGLSTGVYIVRVLRAGEAAWQRRWVIQH